MKLVAKDSHGQLIETATAGMPLLPGDSPGVPASIVLEEGEFITQISGEAVRREFSPQGAPLQVFHRISALTIETNKRALSFAGKVTERRVDFVFRLGRSLQLVGLFGMMIVRCRSNVWIPSQTSAATGATIATK